MYEFGRGVRIFENIAGVRIRTLVYEKKKLCLASAKREFDGTGRTGRTDGRDGTVIKSVL